MKNTNNIPEMKNLVWSVYETESEELSNSVERVFWHQHQENGFVPSDGLYPFFNHYGLSGKVRIKNGMVDVQHLDKQIPKRYQFTNDHVFVELMTMNSYGLIEMWLGS